VEEHSHHRHDDIEYIEDHYVNSKFCEQTHKDMERRMGVLESSNKDLVEQTNKSNTKLAIILGVMTFLAAAAGILAQYLAILPIIKGVHP
jgi:hypothetical protein